MGRSELGSARSVALVVAVAVAAGCATGPQAPPRKPPIEAARRVRYFIHPTVAVSADPGTPVPPRIPEDLRDWVGRHMVEVNLPVVADPKLPHDLEVRLGLVVRGSGLFMRGDASLELTAAGVVIDGILTAEEMRTRDVFSRALAHDLVAAMIVSPRLQAFAESRSAPVAAVAGAPPPAAGAPNPEPRPASATPAADPIEQARLHTRQGTAYYDVGRYQDAYREFEAAYLLRQDPALLYNMGQCQRKLGNDQDALRLYKAYIRNAADGPLRREAEERIRELEGAAKHGAQR